VSVAPTARPTDSPVAQDVALELQRVVDRWRSLPLGHALRHLPAVRAVVDRLAASGPAGGTAVPPDLGPGVVMDQLTVVVYDASAAPGCDAASLAAELVALRRQLA
jgi:hypothetical protein